MFKSDTHFMIGSSHLVCEDYSLHGTDPFPYVIISDGCSGANNTDIGSRLLCHAAKKVLIEMNPKFHENWELFGKKIYEEALHSVTSIWLNIDCLEATLLIAFELDNMIKVFVYGDGCIFSKNKSNQMEWKTFQFMIGTPFYPALLLGKEKEYSQWSKFKTGSDDSLIVTTNEYEITKSEQLPFNTPLYWEAPSELVDTLLIGSDGLSTFINKKEKTNITLENVLKEITNFKTLGDGFVKRNMRWLIRYWNNNGYSNYDDISVGVLVKEKG